MTDQEFHRQFPAEFENAVLIAHGAIIGWCGGKGEMAPRMTDVYREALEGAFAEVFDAGVRVGRKVAV